MSLPSAMSGVVLTRDGGPEALDWRDTLPVPRPGPGQVLVRVMAAGVNNTDINTRVGWYSPDVTSATCEVEGTVETGGWSGAVHFPRIQGGDICGVVVAPGKGVRKWARGARVTCPINLPRPAPGNPWGFVALGSELDGAFAQYCPLEAGDIYDVTDSPLSDVEIAAMPCAFGTAEHLLNRAGGTAGHSVLITGASGGVGLAAVQLAALHGATVTGITSPAKADTVLEQGATHILARAAARSVRCSDRRGRRPGLARSDPRPETRRSPCRVRRHCRADDHGRPARTLPARHHRSRLHPSAAGRVRPAGAPDECRPLVSKTYPLDQIAQAQEDFMSKRLPGKLVLIPPKETP